MEKTIKQQLIQLCEEDYRIFTSKLLPATDNILGVRLPILRKMAKGIAAKDWRNYLDNACNEFFEEVMLEGMVIGYAKGEFEEIFNYVEKFVAKIDNWSVCDSFCAGLKITNKYKDSVWEFLKQYHSSENEFEVRFCVVMFIDFYIDEEHIYKVFEVLNNIKNQGYYAKIAIAWAVSICYIKLPTVTAIFLNKNNLDDYTFNKALQKIIESNRVDKATKEVIRNMKRG